MRSRRLSTTYDSPREDLTAKLMLMPRIESNFHTTELAITAF